MAGNELGEYIRTLRGQISPQDVGLPDTRRRRVPGLRRAEVSQLVGLSTEYYIRLEQGRADRPSQSVLLAISRVLQLDTAQQAHLFDLAQHPRGITPTEAEPLRSELSYVVEGISRFPALVMNRGMKVLSWNLLARHLIADFDAIPSRDRNMARQVFLNPEAREIHGDWDRAARDTVGILRLAARRPPVEREFVELIDELHERSGDFRRLWETHYVHEKTHGQKVFRHPTVGTVELQYETFTVSGQAQHMLVVFTTPTGSHADECLKHLALQPEPIQRAAIPTYQLLRAAL